MKEPLTMAGLWDFYIRGHCANARCSITNARGAEKEFNAGFGEGAYIETITQDDLQAHIEKRMKKVVGATVRKTFTLYYAACNKAKKRKLIKDFEKVDLPPPSQPRKRYLTPEECLRVVTAAKSHSKRLWLFFWIALETAARSKAIEELTWDRVFLDQRIIDFRVPGAVYKNKRRGTVAISDDLYAILSDERKEALPEWPVIGFGGSTVHAAKAVMVSAGINEAGVCRHVMRRTWATLAAKGDISMKRIATQLHDSVVTVDKSYAHLSAQDMIETVNQFSRMPKVVPKLEAEPQGEPS